MKIQKATSLFLLGRFSPDTFSDTSKARKHFGGKKPLDRNTAIKREEVVDTRVFKNVTLFTLWRPCFGQ